MSIVDVSQQYVKGKCDLKCDYSYKYHKSNSIATNSGSSIMISYEDSGVPPVTYNNIKYNVDFIEITYPSSALYNGSPALANLAILHTSVKHNSLLIIIIPIVLSESTNRASSFTSDIINSVASSAPNDGEKVTLNIPDFSLQDVIPKKPFYTLSEFTIFNLILFDLEGAIPMSQTTFDTFSKIIQAGQGETSSQLATILASPNASKEIIPLFYNSKGPNSSNNVEDEIYISCKPTGNSEETENVTFQKQKNSTSAFQVDLAKLFKNPYFVYLFYALIFIVLLVFLNMIINIISSGGMKIPFFSKKNNS